MINTRGNTYSKNHTYLDTCSSCPEFWTFCWHEGGILDYSAVIDHVLVQMLKNFSLWRLTHGGVFYPNKPHQPILLFANKAGAYLSLPAFQAISKSYPKMED
jgi:hypothetical protein